MITGLAFKDAFVQCFKRSVIPKKVLVALSGGVDSICMTYLLSQYAQQFNKDMQIHAITIDHNYRKESALEAQNVGKLVNEWGVIHHIVPLTYDKPTDQITNFELVARNKRYEEFQQFADSLKINHLFVAHNYDDQLETCMIRISQSSTFFGIPGLKPVSTIPVPPQVPSQIKRPVQVIRPLLPFDKQQIYDTCRANGVKWFEDHTNQDVNLTSRNLFRYALKEFIPHTLEVDPESPYKEISKDSLENTIEKTQALTNYVEDQVRVLTRKLGYKLNEKNGSIVLSMSVSEFHKNGPMVLSRLLFQKFNRISAMKNYHFGYTRVFPILPKLEEAVDNPETLIKFTGLQLYIEAYAKNDKLTITACRQPIMREEKKSVIKRVPITAESTEWILFDRRYWLRFSSVIPCTATVTLYVPSKHALDLKLQYGKLAGKAKGKTAEMAPLIKLDTGEWCLPTFGLIPPNLNVEWYLKDTTL